MWDSKIRAATKLQIQINLEKAKVRLAHRIYTLLVDLLIWLRIEYLAQFDKLQNTFKFKENQGLQV